MLWYIQLNIKTLFFLIRTIYSTQETTVNETIDGALQPHTMKTKKSNLAMFQYTHDANPALTQYFINFPYEGNIMNLRETLDSNKQKAIFT